MTDLGKTPSFSRTLDVAARCVVRTGRRILSLARDVRAVAGKYGNTGDLAGGGKRGSRDDVCHIRTALDFAARCAAFGNYPDLAVNDHPPFQSSPYLCFLAAR